MKLERSDSERIVDLFKAGLPTSKKTCFIYFNKNPLKMRKILFVSP